MYFIRQKQKWIEIIKKNDSTVSKNVKFEISKNFDILGIKFVLTIKLNGLH